MVVAPPPTAARRRLSVLLLASLVLSLGLHNPQSYAYAAPLVLPAGRSAAASNAVQALLPPSLPAYLKAPVTDAGDYFGSGIVLQGDTLVVGAFREDSAATGVGGDGSNNAAPDAGAVWVFVRTEAGWTPQAYLKASNAAAGDGFGASGALDGDTLVVGATGEASGATGVNGNQGNNSIARAGAAYVFVRSGTTWTQQAYLKPAEPRVSGFFGEHVAIEGDTVVVGGGGAQEVGIFLRQPAQGSPTWTVQATLLPPPGAAFAGFGWRLALQGDRLVVGAAGARHPVTNVGSGTVYVFGRSGTTWSLETTLTAPNAEAGDTFGASVALAGDTIVVSAPGEASAATGVGGDQDDNTANYAGAVYVFAWTGTTWTPQAYLKASNTAAGDGFGTLLVLQGDTLVVSAEGEDSAATGVGGDQTDNSAPNAGAVYVFVRTGTTWTQQAYVKASNTDAGDLFCYWLALDDTTLIVGAMTEDSAATGVDGDQTDNSAPNAGAVYVVDVTAAPLTPQFYLPTIWR